MLSSLNWVAEMNWKEAVENHQGGLMEKWRMYFLPFKFKFL